MKPMSVFFPCVVLVCGCYKTSVDLSPLVDGGVDSGPTGDASGPDMRIVDDMGSALDMEVALDMGSALDMTVEVDAGEPTFVDPCRLVTQSASRGAPDGDSLSYAHEVAPHSMRPEEDFVVFASNATNLTDEALAPGTGAVYRRDCNTGINEFLFAADVSEIEYAPSREAFSLVTASALVASDTNALPDVYLYSFDGGTLQRLSVSALGGESSGMSYAVKPVQSDVGEAKWAFFSTASLTGTGPGIFLRDPVLGTTQKLVGGLANEFDASYASPCLLYKDGDGYLRFDPDFLDADAGDFVVDPESISVPSATAFRSFALSADCATAAFVSADSALVAGDTNGHADVFVVDLASGSIRVVGARGSGSVTEFPTGGDALEVDVEYFSSGGYYVVAFSSEATNIADVDLNGTSDIFTAVCYSPSAGDVLRGSILTGTWEPSTVTSTAVRGISRAPRLDSRGELVTFTSRDSEFAGGRVLPTAVYTVALPWWI